MAQTERGNNPPPSLSDWMFQLPKRNYSVEDQKTMVIVLGIKKSRYCRHGKLVHLYTDHEAPEQLIKHNAA